MAVYFTGTLLASPIVRGSTGDTYGTHHSILGVGGYMEVNTLAERNILPVDSVNGIYFDGISSGQRRLGMLVYVRSEDTIYQLKYSGSTAWDSLPPATKVTELGNNSNWVVFDSGSGNIKSDRIIKEISQTTHGFLVGDIIGWDNSGEYTKAIADGTYDGEFVGVVTEVIDNNTFKITEAGYFDTLSSLSANTTYFLSDVTAGLLTNIKPTIDGHIVKPILIANSATSGWILPYPGYVVTTGQTVPSNIITGATNVGFFSGNTGVQILPINHLTENIYDGDYISLYNNYYRDEGGVIRIGASSSDNIPKRGYYNATSDKSWIWDDSSSSRGWQFIDGNVENLYGTTVSLSTTYTPIYTGTSWTEGTAYNNGSDVTIGTVLGNLSTGSTYTNGGGVYKQVIDHNFKLRTIISETPNLLKVSSDDYFIKLSGTSLNSAQNVGSGFGVYSGISGQTLILKSLVPSGDTVISETDDSIIIYTESVSGSTSISGAENIGSGIGIYKQVFNDKLQLRSITGGTGISVSLDGDNLKIESTGSTSGVYDGKSPATCSVGGIDAGTVLTGKTVVCLLQDILAPTQPPTIIAPSSSISNTASSPYEIGDTITFDVNTTFNRGIICDYDGTFQNYRSGLPNHYHYSGSGLPSSVASTSLSDSQTVSGYTISGGSQSWGSCVEYDCGPQPLDSDGNPYGSPLSSGCTSQHTTSITGYYYRFYGPTGSTPTNSAEVRSLECCDFQTANVNIFCLNTGTVYCKFSVSLPPSRTISQVIDLDALNDNITSDYIYCGTISVNDGGGTGTTRTYNLYEANAGTPYTSNHRHKITTA